MFNIIIDVIVIGLLIYICIINPFAERYMIYKHEKNGEYYMYNDKTKKWGWFKKEEI